MNSDLAIDEAIAAALPWDFPADFRRPDLARNACERCIRAFLGARRRTLCALCDEPQSESPQ